MAHHVLVDPAGLAPQCPWECGDVRPAVRSVAYQLSYSLSLAIDSCELLVRDQQLPVSHLRRALSALSESRAASDDLAALLLLLRMEHSSQSFADTPQELTDMSSAFHAS